MDCSIEDATNYQAVAGQVRQELSNDKNRFLPMEERRDTSVLSVDVLSSLCHGNTCIILSLSEIKGIRVQTIFYDNS